MNAKAFSSAIESEWPLSPRANPDLKGHARSEQVLIDAFHGPRMAHAWLISGPKGIGKATLAYRFARYVLSHGEENILAGSLLGDQIADEPADGLYVSPRSAVYQRVVAGAHADLMVIERSLNDRGKLRQEIVVDDVREVGGFLSLTAAEGGWRVVIIDSADEMNRNAANAVLKVLEEPPRRAMLLLISHNPGRLLPTIKSRCRKLVMPGLSDELVSELAAEYIPEPSVEDRNTLVGMSSGSIGRAIELARAGGVAFYTEILDLLKTCPGIDIPLLHKLASAWSKAGEEATYSTVMEITQQIVFRLIRALSSPGAESRLLSREMDVYNRVAALPDLDRWLKVWDNVGKLQERADAVNLDRKQVFLNIFLEIDDAASSGKR